jgi:hypothetical protein
MKTVLPGQESSIRGHAALADPGIPYGAPMSSIACFYRVPTASLDQGDDIAGLLAGAADLGDDYDWSGYVMLNLLIALEQAGLNLGVGLPEPIDLGDEVPHFFATQADTGIIDGLDLGRLDAETLSMGLALDDDELREAVGDSVTMLRRLLAGTGPHEVLVIQIW